MPIEAEDILKAFFSITSKVETETVQSIKEEIIFYLEYNVSTAEPLVLDVLQLVKLLQMEDTNTVNFYDACHVVEPIFNRLTKKETWNLYEIRVLATALSNHYSYRSACSLADRLLEQLEAYRDAPNYIKTKRAICYNVMISILHTKFEDQALWKSLEVAHNLYFQYADLCITLFQELKMETHIQMIKIKHALVTDDFKTATEELDKLKLLPNSHSYHKQMLKEYNDHMALVEMTEKYLSFDIGRYFD